MRKFKLLKDLPDLKAGCLFNWSDNNNVYEALNSKTPYIGGHETFYVFSPGTVEGQPEWFEEVQEKEFTKSDMMSFAKFFFSSSAANERTFELWVIKKATKNLGL